MDITKISSDRVQERQTQETSQSQKSQAAAVQKRGDHRAAGVEGSSPAKRAEDVKWSSEARLASEALAAAKAAPDVRADRVAALKASIANGTYKVDSKTLADKMISRSLEDDLLTRG
jgi:negative regulator of flagellin synthesis FlgM